MQSHSRTTLPRVTEAKRLAQEQRLVQKEAQEAQEQEWPARGTFWPEQPRSPQHDQGT
jgi:hypothetical protein